MVQITTLLPLLASLLAVSAAPVSHDSASLDAESTLPTIRESALTARKILFASNTAHFATVYPSDPNARGVPAGAHGKPTVWPHLIADCSEDGTPSVIVFPIAATWRNAKADNGSIAVSVEAEDWTVEKGRVALLGKVVEYDFQSEAEEDEIRECFVAKNPDAKWWLPKKGKNGVHSSRFGKVEVESVQWVGGFGGVARIGELPLDVYKGIERKEVDAEVKQEQTHRFTIQTGRDAL
ncbi:hypothetical protein BJ508DRAFT_414234 [Ascobolus immersus RN42]|uniref:CREG-like beta-barrel domain-containing protein n=1 Tax=Ascobolus immersus RN42 TaxID=1160509 RepID=A0A3N4I9M1_ASCIM|nr:hypothetical protein BJ508DRAFT_414234 [Ascobolus immersus RN42]